MSKPITLPKTTKPLFGFLSPDIIACVVSSGTPALVACACAVERLRCASIKSGEIGLPGATVGAFGKANGGSSPVIGDGGPMPFPGVVVDRPPALPPRLGSVVELTTGAVGMTGVATSGAIVVVVVPLPPRLGILGGGGVVLIGFEAITYLML